MWQLVLHESLFHLLYPFFEGSNCLLCLSIWSWMLWRYFGVFDAIFLRGNSQIPHLWNWDHCCWRWFLGDHGSRRFLSTSLWWRLMLYFTLCRHPSTWNVHRSPLTTSDPYMGCTLIMQGHIRGWQSWPGWPGHSHGWSGAFAGAF